MGRRVGIVLLLSTLSFGSTGGAATGAARAPRPKVAFSTFLGGAEVDDLTDVAVDREGNVYVVGTTVSPDLPTTNAVQESYARGACDFDRPCTDAFVAKLSRDGRTIVYMTYLGGVAQDFANAVAVDDAGNAYVTGGSEANGFPLTPGAFQTERVSGGPDVFVTKLGPRGSLVYSTLVGGDGDWGDYGLDIAVDGSGNAVVTGRAGSVSFPVTPGAFKTDCADNEPYGDRYDCEGIADAFVTKLNASGSDLIFSTFLGGQQFDESGYAVALDGDGNVYVGGDTASDDFPTTPGSFDPRPETGIDAFVTKLDPTGSRLVYSTILGGGWPDVVRGIDVDEDGAAVVAGTTESKRFPTTKDSFAPWCGPERAPVRECEHTDGFVTKLSPDGSRLEYSSYLGGYGYDEAQDVAVDDRGHAWVVGGARSPDFPLLRPIQSKVKARACDSQNCFDVFVARVDRSGDSVDMSTFYGGQSDEMATSIALGRKRSVYVGGRTHSVGFPVVDALEPDMQSPKSCKERHPYYVVYRCADGFVLKIRDPADPDAHPRRVTLRLRRHLVARGRVEVSTGESACARNVPVTIVRSRADAKVVGVTRTRTNDRGRYRVRLKHREAFFGARIPEVAKRGGDVCQRTETWAPHFHPTA